MFDSCSSKDNFVNDNLDRTWKKNFHNQFLDFSAIGLLFIYIKI